MADVEALRRHLFPDSLEDGLHVYAALSLAADALARRNAELDEISDAEEIQSNRETAGAYNRIADSWREKWTRVEAMEEPSNWQARAQAMKQNLESRARASGFDGSYLNRTPDSHGGAAFFSRRTFDELYLVMCHFAGEEPAEDYAAYLARAEAGYPNG